MTAFRHLVSAAAVAAALQLAPAVAQARATAPSPDVVYHAPSWWITAVVQGKQATLLTGDADLDRRMQTWLVGFGYGLGEGCGLTEGRALEAMLQQHVSANPALRSPGTQGTKDGQRFAEINGCSSADTQSARRTIAGIGGSIQLADLSDRRENRRRDVERRDDQRDVERRDEGRDMERRDTDRFETDRHDVVGAREAIVVNRSGARIDVLRMSETTDRDWGEDRLGRDVLFSGDGVRVRLGDSRSCHYDLRVVYADARFEERMNVNLCANAEVVFNGRGAQFSRQPTGDQARLGGVDGYSSQFTR